MDEIALGFNGIVLDVREGGDIIRKLRIVDAVITAFDVADKVFADKTLEQGAQHICLKSQPSTAPRTSLAICQIWRCSAARCWVLVILESLFKYGLNRHQL